VFVWVLCRILVVYLVRREVCLCLSSVRHCKSSRRLHLGPHRVTKPDTKGLALGSRRHHGPGKICCGPWGHLSPPNPVSVVFLWRRQQCIHHTALRTTVTALFIFTAIRLIASHLDNMITSISGIHHPGVSFEDASLRGERFCYGELALPLGLTLLLEADVEESQ